MESQSINNATIQHKLWSETALTTKQAAHTTPSQATPIHSYPPSALLHPTLIKDITPPCRIAQ
jgi:hypothetical protein